MAIVIAATTAIMLTSVTTTTNKWNIIIIWIKKIFQKFYKVIKPKMSYFLEVVVDVKVILYGSNGGLQKGNRNNNNNSKFSLGNRSLKIQIKIVIWEN